MNNITLTTSQQAAFDTLLGFSLGRTQDHTMAVLEGFAGTGKTTLIGKLLGELQGLKIAIAAPTNKAVKVLREKIGEAGLATQEEPTEEEGAMARAGQIAFGSIHAMLGMKLSERDDGTQECKSARDPQIHKFDLVVVDECSMIDGRMFEMISVHKRGARVLFVGDPAQLPPIDGNGAVSPVFSRVQLRLTLSEVVRQAEDNPIIALSVRIRRAIEQDRRMDALGMAEVLPPLPADAALVAGDWQTAVDIALWEIGEGHDARIVAFTNDTVQGYNRAIHEALHGYTSCPFVVGERVIVHQQCAAQMVDEEGKPAGTGTTLITSEEAVVAGIEERAHPFYGDIPSRRLILRRDDGGLVAVYLALDDDEVQRRVNESFAEWRRLKLEADALEKGLGRSGELRRMRDAAKQASGKAWQLRKAFAPLRHAYAITTHKSQGSTFDTAIVDLADLNRMRSTFEFNRALYVAVTRPRHHLAMVA